jgi:hypothetical protein
MTSELPNSSGVAMYYPNIDVESNWLKTSLLYWDSVRRIIPQEAEWEIHDSPDIRRSLEEGCLINTSPADYREAASQLFIENFLPLLEKGLSKPARQVKQLARRLNRQRSDGFLHQSNMPPQGYVHPNKITHRLIGELQRRGCIKEEGNWLRVPQLVSGLYMVCLGGEMSRRIGTPLLTDVKEFATGGEYALFGTAPPVNELEERRNVLLKLGLRFPRPDALAQVPMQRVIEFNRQSFAERKQLRLALDGIVSQSQSITDFHALQDFWNERKRDVSETIQQHRRRLDEIGVSAGFMSFLKISAPLMVTLIPNTEWIDTSALAAMGLAIGAVDWWANLRGKRELQERNCPWHYALRLEKTFRT